MHIYHLKILFKGWNKQYLEEEEQRRQFPHVLQLGDKFNCSQAFVIVGGAAREQDSLLQAVDTCFKIFYALDIDYPKPLFGSFYNTQ